MKKPLTRTGKRIAYVAMTLGAVLLLLVASGMIAEAIHGRQRARTETAHTTGTVVKTGFCGKGQVDGTAEFTVHGETYTAKVACDADDGARVPVAYDPQRPWNANDNGGMTGIYAGIGASGVFAVAVAYGFWDIRRRPLVGKAVDPVREAERRLGWKFDSRVILDLIPGLHTSDVYEVRTAFIRWASDSPRQYGTWQEAWNDWINLGVGAGVIDFYRGPCKACGGTGREGSGGGLCPTCLGGRTQGVQRAQAYPAPPAGPNDGAA